MMHRGVFSLTTGRLALATLLLTVCAGETFGQLDERWTVTINGQTVQVEADGSFLISNVSAPDVFGPGGPGTGPDGFADDVYRLTGVRTTGSGTLYVYSPNAVRILPNDKFTFSLGSLTVTPFAPVLPESIALTTLGNPIITPLGSDGQCPNAIPCSVPLQTMATLSDPLVDPDFTLPSKRTTYRASNVNIARVVADPDPMNPTAMLVEGVSPGVAFITATNGGATSVIKITVANPGDLISTTVEGFVRDTNGLPVGNAAIAVQLPTTGPGGEPLLQRIGIGASDATGFFSIGSIILPDTTPGIFAQAEVEGSMTELGSSALVTPVPGGITDVGIITIDTVCDTPWSSAFGPTIFDTTLDATVLALVVFDDDTGGPNPPALFAGGDFQTAGGTPANNIAKWDGVRWLPLGNGVIRATLGEAVQTLAVIDLDGAGGDPPALYVGGHFAAAGGVVATNIAQWDGANWSALGGGVGDTLSADAMALAAYDDGTGMALYVGGGFSTANDGEVDVNGSCVPNTGCVEVSNIAKWNPTTQTWSPVGTDLDKPVHALAVFDEDGDSPNPPMLFAGGEFGSVGSTTGNRIARWDGTNWTQVGPEGLPGVPDGDNRVEALLVFDDGSGVGPALYAGGLFQGPGGVFKNIARWDGNTWTPLGNSIDAASSESVLALAGYSDGLSPPLLYASGDIKSFGGGSQAEVKFVAQWSGSTWSGSPTWDGTGWSELGAGIESFGTVLSVFDDGAGAALYVGGAVADNIDCASGGGGVLLNTQGYVAKWDAPEWSVLGNGLNDEVQALVVHDDGSGSALFAGGSFTPPKGPCDSNESRFPSGAVARFDGLQWSSLGAGMGCTGFGCIASVNALAVFDEDGPNGNPPLLFAGGDFAFADGVSADNMARWDGSNWSAVGTVGGIVEALAVFDDDGPGINNPPALYAGGLFFVGGGNTDTVRKWDPNGQAWLALGSGMSAGAVFAIATFDDGNGSKLYVGGNFPDAGGVPGTANLARWDGSSWSAVGSGVTGSVYALTVFDDGTGPTLYVGGEFLKAGVITVNRVAKWNGVIWSAMGSGLGPNPGMARVDALAAFDNGQGLRLYAGGDFTTAGGSAVNRIAKWTGSVWIPVGVSSQPGADPGGGVDTCTGFGCEVSVNALAVFDDGATGPALFAGGSFQTAGGQTDLNSFCVAGTGCVPAGNIAKLGCR